MDYRLQFTLMLVLLVGGSMFIGIAIVPGTGKLLTFTLNPTITGGVVAGNCIGNNCHNVPVCTVKQGNACRIACITNADCSDHIPNTKDICRNPGTEFSLCVNQMI